MVFKVLSLTFEENHSEEDGFVTPGRLKRFSLAELKAATQNFNEKNIIGRGGFGTVYKGRLADGSPVAVKRLRSSSKGGEEQFRAEVEFANAAGRHPNLVRLQGFCMTRKERMLVYPLMAKRSVASRLRERQVWEMPLDWHTRKQIALGAAKGLAHLHESCHLQIIHRDVKAANILLDDDFNAVLCDFGLAKFVHHNTNNRIGQVDQQSSDSGLVLDPFPEPLDQLEEDHDQDLADESSSTRTRDDDHTVMSCWNFTITRTIGNYEKSSVWFTPGGGTSCWQCKENSSSSTTKSKSSNEPIKLMSSRMKLDRVRSTTNYNKANNDMTDITHVTTAVRGTIGHIAPEYLSTGRCSVKTDVFAYGVMLLELISGKRAFDLSRVASNQDLMVLDWIKRLLKENELELVVDSDMMGNYDAEEVEQLLQLALLCTTNCPWFRPKMLEVIQMLADGPDGVFLAQNWKELPIKEEEFRTANHWRNIVDSTENLRPEELSGPR